MQSDTLIYKMKNQEQKKDIWIGVEHLENDPHFLESINKEFAEDTSLFAKEEAMEVKANRRDFLKILGFSVSAATVAASCDIPVKRAIPYVTKPDEIVPGVASYYASSFVNGGDYCPVLVKTREDGRSKWKVMSCQALPKVEQAQGHRQVF